MLKTCQTYQTGLPQGSLLAFILLALCVGLTGATFSLCSCSRYLQLRKRQQRRHFQMSLGEDLSLMMSDEDSEFKRPDEEVYSRTASRGSLINK